MEYRHALVLGATGATGKELINLLLNDSNFDKVTIFVRRKVDIKHQKLNIHLIDFSNLNKYKALVKGDLLFSALGTTKKDAGSKMYFFTQWQKFCQTAARLILIERNATHVSTPIISDIMTY